MKFMDNTTLRLLDANFNRAREALRVMEDYARFILNDSSISAMVKQSRHDLSRLMGQLPALEMIAARDTPGDVGTSIRTSSELERHDAYAVVTAAAKRLPEALRSLEEFCKIEHCELAVQLETLRYRSYELEKKIANRSNLKDRFEGVRLYVLLTEELCQMPVLQVVQGVLDGGADCIQLREKDLPDAQKLIQAQQICQLCREKGALFIMNDRPDLAVLADADGIHLGQEDLSVADVRNLIPSRMLIGKSTHSVSEAEAALAEGADYLAVGSIFASSTKPDLSRGGLELIRHVRQISDGPIIAIGGINTENSSQAIAAGASGVAVCQYIIAAEEPQKAAAEIKNRLGI